MIIRLVKQNDEFSRGLKATTAETLITSIKTHLREQSSICFRKIIGNGF